MIESIDETTLRALRQAQRKVDTLDSALGIAEATLRELEDQLKATEARVQELEKVLRLTLNELIPYAAALRAALSPEGPQPMILTVIPAYGRDYTSKKEVEAAWRAGKDFQDPPSGAYFNIKDLPELQAEGYKWLNIRYKSLSQVHVIKLGA